MTWLLPSLIGGLAIYYVVYRVFRALGLSPVLSALAVAASAIVLGLVAAHGSGLLLPQNEDE